MEDIRTQEQEGLRRRIHWLLTFRLVFASVLLVATLIWRPGGDYSLFGPSFLGVFIIVLAHLVAALGFFLLFRRRPIRRTWGFALSQIAWDLFFTTAFVSITGGLDSDFKYLYWLTIVIAAVMLFRVGAYIAAAFSGFLYGLLLNLQYFGLVLPLFNVTPESALWPEDRIWRSIIVQSAGFFIVAYIFGALSGYLKQAETMLSEKSADLEDLEALMRRIVESLTSGLVTLDSGNRVSYWSRSAEAITGLAADDVRGREISALFPEAQEFLNHSGPAAPGGDQPWRWEVSFDRGDRTRRILGFSVSPLSRGTDGQSGTLIIFQDLTTFREMEERMKRKDRLAAVGELAARIAHEIRNPLTSVSGAIQVLKSDLKLEERDQRLMEIVLRETDRLNQLLTDFLYFARPSAPQFEEVAVGQLLKETSELFQKSHPRGRFRFDLKGDDDVLVRGDSRQLNQLFWNLFKNASEAMPEGGRIGVSVRRDEKTDFAVIEVRDEGAGIARAIQKEVFTPFFTTKTKGTGLGLAVVQRIAEDHAGRVDIESEEGKGAAFRVSLPLFRDGAEAAGRV